MNFHSSGPVLWALGTLASLEKSVERLSGLVLQFRLPFKAEDSLSWRLKATFMGSPTTPSRLPAFLGSHLISFSCSFNHRTSLISEKLKRSSIEGGGLRTHETPALFRPLGRAQLPNLLGQRLIAASTPVWSLRDPCPVVLLWCGLKYGPRSYMGFKGEQEFRVSKDSRLSAQAEGAMVWILEIWALKLASTSHAPTSSGKSR